MRWVKTEIKIANSGGYLVVTEWVIGEATKSTAELKHDWWGWYREIKEYAFSTWKEVKEYLDKLGEKQDEIQKIK